MLRYLRRFAEFAAAFLGLVLLVVALIVWRLSDSPVNSAFLVPYIEAGIERYIPGAHAQVAHAVLTWDGADHSMQLRADGLQIKNGKGGVIGEVPNVDLRLSLVGLLVGQFWPIELNIDHPQLQLDRHADGKLYFAAMATQGDDDTSGEEDGRDVLRTALHNLTHAYAMRHLAATRIAIAIHDDATGRNWSVSVPEISLKRTFAQLVGEAKIDLTQKDDIATLDVDYAYDPLKALHHVSTRFQGITPAQLAGGHPEAIGLVVASAVDLPLSGEIEVAFDPDLMITAAAANLHGGKGAVTMPALWDKPRGVTSFDIEGDFDRKAGKLNLATAVFDFGGPKLRAMASGKPSSAKYDMDFTLKVGIENWPMDGFADLWPKPLLPNPRAWMEQNLAKGTYDKGEATIGGSLSWNDLDNLAITSLQARVAASHGALSYIDGMPPVEDVSATADFDLQKMKATITGGGIGNLRLEPFTLTINGLDANDQTIDIPLKVAGPIPDVVRLIDHPPLRYGTKVGLSPDDLNGTAEGTVHLVFPLLKSLATKDINVDVDAALSNVATQRLVKGIDITDGQLQLTLTKDSFSVKGPAALNKIPLQMDMLENFEPGPDKPLRQINVTGNIQNDQWKQLGASFAGTTGTTTATLQATQPDKGATVFSGNLDMTATDMHFAPLNWKKPAGQAAILKFDGQMAEGKDITIKSINLNGPQVYAQGKAVVGIDGTLKSASLTPLRLGRTNANLSLSQSPEAGGTVRLEATGKSLDIGGQDNVKQAADTRPKEFHLKLDRLLTSEDGVIADAEGYAVRDAEGWKEISLHGLADGEHKLDIELTPQDDGSSSFLVTCDDFGKMLKGLGLTDTVKEGDVKIEGASTPDQPRVIIGTAQIGSFTVGKLPVLALLLNATSPFGFSGLVTNSASFEHMNGGFRWSGDQIELLHMNAAGTSVGMNIAGKVDMNSGKASLHGTLVPFSMMNRILGSIPFIGDILTGGDGGGVLAIAYTIKGTLSAPQIDVNPISLLTPGFIRNLFFGGDDADLSETPEEPASPRAGDNVKGNP